MTLIGSVGPLVEKSEAGLAFDRGENPLVLDDAEALDTLLTLMTERPPPSTRAMRRYLGEQRAARRDAQLAIFRGWSEPADGEGLPTDLKAIDTPTLVIHGARDRVVHPATARALAEQLGNARLMMMDGIGHVPQMEAPAAVARAIDSFVGDVEKRRVA